MTRTAATAGLLIALLCPGCAQVDKAMFDLNMGLAQNVFQPVSKGYRTVVPAPIRTGLRNATDNLRYTDVMVNNLLQGKVDRAFSDAGRMAINWVCFAGLFDAATDIGIPKYDEDFGQTLGFHGVAPGPYFNMPFFGPTTVRDFWRWPARIATSPLTWGVDSVAVTWSVSVTTYFFQRFDDVDDLNPVLEAVDPYEFVKKAYLERREFLVHDGNPPDKKEEEKAIDEALEDLDDLESVRAGDGLEGLEDGDTALRGLDDLEELPGLEPLDPATPQGPVTSPGADLEGLDDLDELEKLEPAAPASTPADGALPPPRIIRRPAVRDVPDPKATKSTARPSTRLDGSHVESKGALPPPAVRKR